MKEMLIGQFKAVEGITKANLEGVDHAASLAQPEGTGNCIYWNVGHLTNTYNALLPALGQETVWNEEVGKPYARKSPRLDTAAVTTPFEQMVADLNTANDRFVAGLAALGKDRYSEEAPFSPTNNPDETLLSLLYTVAFHQSYHCGQIATQRHAAGLAGAIA